jgi:hypothetical protein
MRITLQWRESHDPDFKAEGADPYREPLSKLRLRVLRQPDPEGVKRPSDDLVVVAQTTGRPLQIQNEPNSAVYEYVLDFTADAAARYALRVEGSAPASIQPPGTATLPAIEQAGELRPRIFIDTADGNGRVVLEHYATRAGVVGVPAGAVRVQTVSAIDEQGKPQPYSSDGPAMGAELTLKPDLRAFDRLGLEQAKTVGGSAISAGYVAGYAAALLGHGTAPEQLLRELRLRLRLSPRMERADR